MSKRVQCECIITDYHPFRMGGNPYDKKRCENEATILVYGKTKKEKRQPPMAICVRCYEEFKKLNPDYKIKRISVVNK